MTIPEASVVIHTPGTVLESKNAILIEKPDTSVSQSQSPDTSGPFASPERPLFASVGPVEAEMLAYIQSEESSGNPTAQNPRSSAYGLYGFLDSTWSTVGCTKTSEPMEQERCAILYMEQRYGGIEGAYHFHKQNDWY